MSNEIVKFSNQFNRVALRKFDAVHLDMLMAIASRIKDKGTEEATFDFLELRQLMQLKKNLTDQQLAEKIVGMNTRLLALNYMFIEHGEIVQFALFTEFRTNLSETQLTVAVNPRFAFLLNELTSQFTRFELAEFTNLKSRYSKEFYRRAKQYRSSGIWRIGRQEFCRLLDVPDSATTTYLNHKVLKPILHEVGPLLNLKINRQYARRRLVGFVFTFSRETVTISNDKETTPRDTPLEDHKSKRDITELDIQKVMQALGSEDVSDVMLSIGIRRKAIALLKEYGTAKSAIEEVQVHH